MSSFCSSEITMPLIDTISSTISDFDGEYAGRILGRCMQTVAQRGAAEWADKINLGLWTRRCVEKWPSSYEVLEGLFALVQAA